MKTIVQTVNFPGVTPAELYETYLDSEKHAAAIGDDAKIERRVGGKFSTFGAGHLVGTILHLLPNRMIVQTWRSITRWKPEELDSILVLTFEKAARGARLNLSHSGVPERDFKLYNEGWRKRYWRPWKAHFAVTRKQRNR